MDGQSEGIARATAPGKAADFIRIDPSSGAEPLIDLRDWVGNVKHGVSPMSAKITQRLYGAMLFVGVVTAATAPANAQNFRYGQNDPAAPVYQFTDTDDQISPAAAQPELRRQVVSYPGNEPAGTIIIDPAHTFLYLTLGSGKAMRYGIGVGREGFEWSGVERITRKAEWPDWTPPPAMVARQPYLPRWIGGGPGNPLGARAMYLGRTDYRIHGTNDPSSIGKHMSSGCIRLRNEDVEDLYSRVGVGTRVIVLPASHSRQIAAAQAGIGMPAAPARHAATPLMSRTASSSANTVSGVY
jgi:lipoprotein-anchoring transpeptidase ErfK/SrfK